MFAGEAVRLVALDGGVVELVFDRRGSGVNKLDRLGMAELTRAVDELAAMAGLRGVVVTSAKEAFIVGADIFEFAELFAMEEDALAKHNFDLKRVFTTFERLPAPTVAAVNGAALGGGLEMALATDYRVLAKSARVGVPEVKLGILPGFGGMVRLPRLAGAAVALEWATSGTAFDGEAALRAGVADRVVDAAHLRDEALDCLRQAMGGSLDWRERRARRQGTVALDAEAMGKARERAAKTAEKYPASLVIVETLEKTARSTVDEALVIEAAALARLAKTPTTAALVRIFTNDQAVRRTLKRHGDAGRAVKRAAVLGAGIMGGGIAYQSAVSGIPVLVQDAAPGAVARRLDEAQAQLEKSVRAGRMAAQRADAARAAMQGTEAFAGFESVDVIVEAVVEDAAVKARLFAELESRVGEAVVIATNTSSLSVGALGATLARPERFVGMHFFNPVPLMPLVEVVRGPRTGDAAVGTVVNFARAMGKTPIVVADCPGFLVNRILVAYLVAFVRLVADGADFAEVDAAMEAYGWPMGPAYLQDVVGHDTGSRVVRNIAAAYDDRMAMPPVDALGLMAERGRLGQKTGVGFYRYERDDKGRAVRTVDPDTLGLLAPLQPKGRVAFERAEIADRMMLPLLVEAARCLEEGVAASPEEIDTALVLGLGYPRHLGGPFCQMDLMGLSEVVGRCMRRTTLGVLYAPTQGMRDRAAAGMRWHA